MIRFGSLSTGARAPKERAQSVNRETSTIPASTSIKVTADKAFKDAVNASHVVGHEVGFATRKFSGVRREGE
ncbi:HU family DNA-binding protein [Caballeronia humi]|uniref:HU family DNA-binding protein n=1 Tax=Caballeronia humi TaxID=326474 RepID=UPI002E16044F|nr:HU family DNA-binding protein [Caballeronia humi]